MYLNANCYTFISVLNPPTPPSGLKMVPSFTARLSSHMPNIGNHQKIFFDDVISNNGNGYSKYSGIFTAPINGTYVFFGSMLCDDFLETEIVANGRSISRLYCDRGGTSHGSDQGSNMAVVALKKGDMLWMHKSTNAGPRLYGYSWSSFSGFRISD